MSPNTIVIFTFYIQAFEDVLLLCPLAVWQMIIDNLLIIIRKIKDKFINYYYYCYTGCENDH